MRHWDSDDYIGPGEDDERRALARRFRDPGGRSALHPGTRIYACPTCGKPRALTAKDRAKGYQCDTCADAAERGGW